MLGIYDSGLGGLTVLGALRAAGVTSDVVYFADQAHVPYGDRSEADLAGLLAENFALLDREGVEGVVMACNTSCAVASRRGWPPAHFAVLDLIENAADALAGLGYSRIAVLATAATVRSGAYGRAIRKRLPAAEVLEIAAPALVPLVERGAAGSAVAATAVGALVATLPAVDAVVYGCTHYPLLDAEFAAALAPQVARFDPASAQAGAARARIAAGTFTPGSATTRYLTNGDLATFERNVRQLTGDRNGIVALVPLPVAGVG
jgi:glutamate racemase